MLAVIFRTYVSQTTGFSVLRALDALKVPHLHVSDESRLVARPDLLAQCDTALVIDDGFGLQPIPGLPVNSVYWGFDFHCDLHKHYDEAMLRSFRYIYAAQYEIGVRLLERELGICAKWLPLAYDDLGMPYSKQVRDIDVSFIATMSTPERKAIKQRVEANYPHHWTRTVFWQEMGNVYSRTKIALNAFGLQTDGKICTNGINMRHFEAMGCGALLLTPKPTAGDLYALFEPGKHLILWENIDDLFEKVNYYLAHPEEREAIAEAGQYTVREHNTYRVRVSRILFNLEGYEG